MAKVSGSYESVVRGVSEQVPQDRLSGQHFEQVNMISDPVRGLARRHGSVMQDEVILPDVSLLDYNLMLADTKTHKCVEFHVDGVAYDLIYRTGSATLGIEGFAWCFNKDERKFIPIEYADLDPTLDLLVSGGVSACTSIGKFLYLAGNSVVPSYTASNPHGALSNKNKLAIWIRGGAYSRTFTATATKSDGSQVIALYKTVSSSYPELLDTSDLLTADPDYQKKVNDRVNAYNSEVTKWIGTSAEDITPENIAQKLVESFVAQGIDAFRLDGTVCIDDDNVVEVEAEDGGDGTLVRAVGNEVSNIDLVSAYHWVGKVVKVTPSRNGGESLYLKAEAKDDVSTGWTKVVWKEAAGYVMQPDKVFIMGTVKSGTLYLASSATQLSAMVGFTCPQFQPNLVGDDLSCPLPDFFGKRITYLGVFQDRLVIGSGSTLLFSRPGDYFNWFRQSVATVMDDDPWEGYALGSEDDTIRYSTTYDRNLLLYGSRFQYMVNGRQPFTPSTASIVVLSAYEDATDAAPQSSGSFVFYAKYSGEPGKEVASLHQVQPGVIADNPESFDLSQQLDRYIVGRPVEIVPLTAPNMVLFRTDADRQRLYTYSYLDNANASQRLFDSWSHWQWSTAVGSLVGVSKHEGGIFAYMLRRGPDKDGNVQTWIACERFVRDSALSDYPYADSLRPLAEYTSPAASAYLNANGTFLASGIVAIDRSQPEQFVGQYLPQLSTFLADYGAKAANSWVGIEYPAHAVPTNPYARDRDGKAILTGRLTVGRINVSVADTAALLVEVTGNGGTRTSLDFIGRILGQPENVPGTQPIVSTNLMATIGGEVRECKYALRAKKWLPLTITAIEWVGQFFSNTKRV